MCRSISKIERHICHTPLADRLGKPAYIARHNPHDHKSKRNCKPRLHQRYRLLSRLCVIRLHESVHHIKKGCSRNDRHHRRCKKDCCRRSVDSGHNIRVPCNKHGSCEHRRKRIPGTSKDRGIAGTVQKPSNTGRHRLS